MTEEQNKNIQLSVELVETLRTLLDWIPSTIEFWNKKDIFPFNMICDSCEDISYDLAQEINKNNEI